MKVMMLMMIMMMMMLLLLLLMMMRMTRVRMIRMSIRLVYTSFSSFRLVLQAALHILTLGIHMLNARAGPGGAAAETETPGPTQNSP